MMEKRAKPGDLCKGDSFQRHYQYRTTWPLAEVLHDKFFLPLRDYLFSGDTITLKLAPGGGWVGRLKAIGGVAR